ncbi:glycosyltransferase [Flavobacteriaceae bacterium M23B6Z8]
MKKILIIGFVWPEPSSSAAGRRMLDLIRYFAEQSYKITFVSTAKKTDFSADLATYGVRTETIKLNDESFDQFVISLKPDVVLFDRFMTEEQFGWRIAKCCPHALRILDTEDLHFLRDARAASVKKYGNLANVELYTDLCKREIASIYRCDLSLFISEAEIELLQRTFEVPSYLLVYFPLIHYKSEEKEERKKTFIERNHFISIGSFRHAPNTDAVQQLKHKLWPEIRKQLPKIELHIYGSYCTEAISALTNTKEGFIVKGRAQSVSGIMEKARAYLAPLRFGAGIKGKLVDAMENELPGVTTSIGAEGISDSSFWNGFIADDETDFIAAAVKLYTDESLWNRAIEKGRILLSEKCSKKSAYEALSESLQAVTADLLVHRKLNFTGAMLMHHTLQSTRYLAKYITLKNSMQ